MKKHMPRLTARELAKELGVDHRFLRDWLGRRKLASWSYAGGLRCYDRDAVMAAWRDRTQTVARRLPRQRRKLATVSELARIRGLTNMAMQKALSRAGVKPVSRRAGRYGWAFYSLEEALAKTERQRRIYPGDGRRR